MDFQGLTDELGQLLSEAAIEISNLDDRENIVYRRLRAMQSRLQTLQSMAIDFKPVAAPLEDFADAFDVSADQILEMAAAGNFGQLQIDGQTLSPAEYALIDPADTAKICLEIPFADIWQAMEQTRHKPLRTSGRAGLRKFAGSEREISSAAPREQRHG